MKFSLMEALGISDLPKPEPIPPEYEGTNQYAFVSASGNKFQATEQDSIFKDTELGGDVVCWTMIGVDVDYADGISIQRYELLPFEVD